MPERFKSPEPPRAPLSPQPVLNGESKVNGALNGNAKTLISASQPELTEDGGTRKTVVKVMRRVVRRVIPSEEETPTAMSPEPPKLVTEPPKPEPFSVPKAMKMPVFSFKHDTIKEDKDDLSSGLTSLMARGRTREPRPRIRKDESPEKEDVKPVEKVSQEKDNSGPACGKTPMNVEASQPLKQKGQHAPTLNPSRSPLSPPPGFIPAPKPNPLSPPVGFVPAPKPPKQPAPKPMGLAPTISPPSAPVPEPKTATPSCTPAIPQAAATSTPARSNTLNPPVPKTNLFAPPAGFIPTPKQMVVKKPEVLITLITQRHGFV